MLKNNYQPAFVMGVISFITGVFFLYASSVLYNRFLDSLFFFPFEEINNEALTEEIRKFFMGTLAIGFIFVSAGIGVMRSAKRAFNIIIAMSIFCLISILFLYTLIVLNVKNGYYSIIFPHSFNFVLMSLLLSSILFLSRKNVDEYFRKKKINRNDDLLDNI